MQLPKLLEFAVVRAPWLQVHAGERLRAQRRRGLRRHGLRVRQLRRGDGRGESAATSRTAPYFIWTELKAGEAMCQTYGDAETLFDC